MKQNPRKYVVSMVLGSSGIGEGRPHIFRLVLEWEPTPKLDKVYANIDNTYCDDRCEPKARAEAEEIAAGIKANWEMRAHRCHDCEVQYERRKEDALKKERK